MPLSLTYGDTNKLPRTLDLAVEQVSAEEFVVHDFAVLLLRLFGYEIRAWTLNSEKT